MVNDSFLDILDISSGVRAINLELVNQGQENMSFLLSLNRNYDFFSLVNYNEKSSLQLFVTCKNV